MNPSKTAISGRYAAIPWEDWEKLNAVVLDIPFRFASPLVDTLRRAVDVSTAGDAKPATEVGVQEEIDFETAAQTHG